MTRKRKVEPAMVREPAAIWPPAYYVREEMEARGWTEADLLERMTTSSPIVAKEAWKQVLGIRPLDEQPTTAHKLAHAFGVSEQFWLNLDHAFWAALHSGKYHLVKDA